MGDPDSELPARHPGERRKKRAHVGSCPQCATDQHASIVTRTDYVLYARCATCGTVWPVPRPGEPPLGSL